MNTAHPTSSLQRKLRSTPPWYSVHKYPQLLLRGQWLEDRACHADHPFTLYRPRDHHLLLVADPDYNTYPIDKTKKIKDRTFRSTRADLAYLVLEGTWFWRCGFGAGDLIELTSPAPGVIELSVLKTNRQREQEEGRLIRKGRSEWKEFFRYLTS